jgi:hypothetical protein
LTPMSTKWTKHTPMSIKDHWSTHAQWLISF